MTSREWRGAERSEEMGYECWRYHFAPGQAMTKEIDQWQVEEKDAEYADDFDQSDEYFYGYLYAGSCGCRTYTLDKDGNHVMDMRNVDHLEPSEDYILVASKDVKDIGIAVDRFEKYAKAISQCIAEKYAKYLRHGFCL